MVIWKMSKDFPVKHAYYHIMENMLDNSAYCEDGDWMLTWSLNVPLNENVGLEISERMSPHKAATYH